MAFVAIVSPGRAHRHLDPSLTQGERDLDQHRPDDEEEHDREGDGIEGPKDHEDADHEAG
jgi:hypothetical protein